METITMSVQGMTCGGCVASVTRVLKAVPGVADVTVTRGPDVATVTYDPAQTGVPALRTAVEDAGYDVAS